jgi:PAS domain S-box-containing protein
MNLMDIAMNRPLHVGDENTALRSILEGTASETGERFFTALVKHLAAALSTQGAWVTEYLKESRRLRSLAFWLGGQFRPNGEYDIVGTPCGKVIEGSTLVHFENNLVDLFPDEGDLKEMGAVSYLGVPLKDLQGTILGHLAVVDSRPMPAESRILAVFQIFAARAAAELQRLRAESEVRKSEEKYRRIVETAGEGFILMDGELRITDTNETLCRLVGYRREELLGRKPFAFLTEEFKHYLMTAGKQTLSKPYREFEATAVAKDGHQIPVLVHSNTLTDDRGVIIGNMALVTDMTEHKKSLALAAEVQKGLLPQGSPTVPELDVAGKIVTCDEIGGDYFDFLHDMECPSDPFGVVVGDVTGHGVDAALIMTTARAFLRMRASQCGSLAQIVTEMNRHLAQDILDTGRFMTLFYMTIDPWQKCLRWVRAGHDPAILYDPERDEFEELKGIGIALGIDKDLQYQENLKAHLRRGQIVAIGTDGIWEALNEHGEMYGKERFRQIVRQHARSEARQILDQVYDDLARFTAGVKRDDDITLVVVKLRGEP